MPPGVQQLSISPLMCQVAVVVVVVTLHPFDASACWHCPALDSQQHKARDIESAEVVHGMVGGDEGCRQLVWLVPSTSRVAANIEDLYRLSQWSAKLALRMALSKVALTAVSWGSVGQLSLHVSTPWIPQSSFNHWFRDIQCEGTSQRWEQLLTPYLFLYRSWVRSET